MKPWGKVKEGKFLQTCMETRSPPEPWLLNTSDHPAATLVNHADTHDVAITIPRRMTKGEWKVSLQYEAHASATQEVNFFHQEMATQIQAGHIVVSPWDTIVHIEKLCMSPVA